MEDLSKYYLSDSMKRYINSHDSKYKVNDKNLVINRSIACAKTTREGQTRADTTDFICRELREDTNIGGLDLETLRIRKLTPKECWRLQGFSIRNEDGTFDDSNFEKAEKVNSNAQLYKQAGNSITVDVLCAIFKELFKEELNGNN